MAKDAPAWRGTYAQTRSTLQRVAAHVVARRRAVVTGRFGLRAVPGGFASPMFGDDEVVRVSGTLLVREQRVHDRAVSATVAIPGTTLRSLSAFAGIDDLDPGFSVGRDTPPLGDVAAPLDLDGSAASRIAEWYAFGARALDRAVQAAGSSGDASVAQLWPEHFDLGVDLAVGDTRVNLGVSPGDDFSASPYLYVGPWTADRPGDADYWNAPFGAAVGYDEIGSDEDADAFFARGLALVTGSR